MNAADAARLLENVQVEVPGVLEDMVKLQTFNAVEEFLKRSTVWRADFSVATIVGTTDYDLTQAGKRVTSLVKLADANDNRVSATMAEPPTMVLKYEPTTVQALTATLSLTVSANDGSGYPDFPDWISAKYTDALIQGVLARLFAQPAKPYGNPTLAMFYGRKFRDATAEAKAEATRMNVYAGQAWAFPQAFVARGRP